MKLKIALIQFHPASGMLKENRERVNFLIEKTVKREGHLDLIVLPETWTSIYSLSKPVTEQALVNAETVDGESLKMLKRIAEKYHVWIAAGSITLSKNDSQKYYNAQFLIDRDGNLAAEYDKIHLCKWVHEDDVFEFGETPQVVSTEIGKLGLIVCYDIRFPELISQYAASGAEILIVPACFSTSLYHWRQLLIARAIENQMFVLGCDCCEGISGKEVGHSMIVDPMGEIVAEAGDEEEVLVAEIDLDDIHKTRSTVTYIQDRRPEIYQQ